MGDASESLLGKSTDYSNDYSPSLLFPLERSRNRATLNITGKLPFHGEDLWTGYELSWLNLKGKPLVAIADFHFPANSKCMVESKSFKLYLNSLNHQHYACMSEVKKLLENDLSSAVGETVRVELNAVDKPMATCEPKGSYSCLDDLDVSGFEYQPNASLLEVNKNSIVTKKLNSHLLRSNCPVTGQPDWASVYIDYTGPEINEESLLKYVVSFRECQDFHEHCVERIFMDLSDKCMCESLSVYARYTRRGGLDINPYRATLDKANTAPLFRTIRQ